MRISFVALLLLCMMLAFPAAAENPCALADAGTKELQLAGNDSGISGTGLNGGDESGIGGTGRSGKDESGLGGTGYQGGDESGMGGTGIYGTITAFGSICVNGLRVHYDDETQLSQDGVPANASALAVGQVVAVEAMGKGKELRASKVAIQSVLTGTVTGVEKAASRFTVMGQTVIASAGSKSLPEVGSQVAVSGMRRADGTIEASRVARGRNGEPDSVSGIARWVDDDSLEVGGVRVNAARAKLADIEDGDNVRVSGSWNADDASIDSARVGAAPTVSESARHLSLEGFVETIPGDERAWIGGVELDRASFERAVARPDVPLRMRVTGVRDRAGRLRIERVDRPPRPKFDRPPKKPDALKVERRKKIDKIDKQRSIDRKRPDRPDRKRKPVRPDRPVRPERPERPERPDPPDRPTVIDIIKDRAALSN